MLGSKLENFIETQCCCCCYIMSAAGPGSCAFEICQTVKDVFDGLLACYHVIYSVHLLFEKEVDKWGNCILGG